MWSNSRVGEVHRCFSSHNVSLKCVDGDTEGALLLQDLEIEVKPSEVEVFTYSYGRAIASYYCSDDLRRIREALAESDEFCIWGSGELETRERESSRYIYRWGGIETKAVRIQR